MKNSRIFVYVMEKKGLKINADKTSWYVLYTAPRAEKQVRDRIDALGVECWLPLHRAPRVWSDRVKIVELPLFNSYLFVRCTDPELRNLTRVYGVARIVYYNGKPPLSARRRSMPFRIFSTKHPNMLYAPAKRSRSFAEP